MTLQESQTIEFKETWKDEYLKTVCAFANTDGGVLYIGINDKGAVVGVDNIGKLMEDLPNKVMNNFVITVDVKMEMAEDKQFIKMIVRKRNIALSYHGKYYTRSGSTTQELKGGALQRLLLKANNLSWDEIGVGNADFNDINTDTVTRFIVRATEYNRLPSGIDSKNIKRLFQNLKLLTKDGELTRAAILLFGREPARFFSCATFKIGRFRGADPTDLIIQDRVEGNLFTMFEQVIDLLKSKYLLSPISYQGMQRIETLEIPEKAIREVVLNSLIHRDYANPSAIGFRVYDTTVSIWNTGELENLQIEELSREHDSYQRNPLIADIFYRAGYIEAWGRGTLTIINETVKSGLPEPTFRTRQEGLEVTFQRNTTQNEKASDVKPYNIQITERQQKAVEYIRQNGNISNKIYQEINNVSKPTASRDLQKLVTLGIIDMIGTAGENIKYVLVGS
jgi:ATP-dependent DNA helicase RecG